MGEVTALRRCDVDTVNRTARVQGAYVERANWEMILGPTKSRAGMRTVSAPAAIVPHLVAHLDKYVRPGADALVFSGIKGWPLRRSGFNQADPVEPHRQPTPSSRPSRRRMTTAQPTPWCRGPNGTRACERL